MPKLGIGMDASVTPLRDGKFCLAQTTDFFYPIVDDPYIQGKIACANVLSDLYAMGVPFCDNMLMICGVSNQLTDRERDVVIPLMMKGFKDAANEAGSNVTGGQTVLNPWITIGGVASSVCLPGEIIMPDAAVAGDVLVLTKPLGTQLASLAYQWMITDSDKWKKIQSKFCERDIRQMYHRAMDSMQRLNRTAAQLMHKYKAHAATDVTGFGLKGHAQNLVENQNEKLLFTISTVPVIANVSAVAEVAGMKSRLHAGTLPETSGGLLICLPRQEAALFCEELELLENRRAWIIGEVLAGSGTAEIVESPRIAECPDVDTVGALW